MSNQNNKRFKLNTVDVFIIALIAICIFSIVLRSFFVKNENDYEKYDEFLISFKTDEIRSSSVEYFCEGDLVQIKRTGKDIGRLLGGISGTPAIGEYTENGAVFYPDTDSGDVHGATRYNVHGTILARGEMTNSGLLLESGIYIHPNSEFYIITEHVETRIKVTAIDSNYS
jgi:hypothetical protein